MKIREGKIGVLKNVANGSLAGSPVLQKHGSQIPWRLAPVLLFIFGNKLILDFFRPLATGDASQQNVGKKPGPTGYPVKQAQLPLRPRRRAVGPERVAADAIFIYVAELAVYDFLQVVLLLVSVRIGMRVHRLLRILSLSGTMPGHPSGLLNVSYQMEGRWS